MQANDRTGPDIIGPDLKRCDGSGDPTTLSHVSNPTSVKELVWRRVKAQMMMQVVGGWTLKERNCDTNEED
ncbi:hypothetical protein Pmani_039941 [Petrolisthes manimaculis]|uniref:Uncharacterized protein n=1 Tax=Petrolisthes manimaculis TaxID=1843537 RepID=A0AAE1NBR9_9EUCA|nr:hypothetical protein Pmani_039941 [Petrolisthes manimaculis]